MYYKTYTKVTTARMIENTTIKNILVHDDVYKNCVWMSVYSTHDHHATGNGFIPPAACKASKVFN